eukprot:gene13766-15207_t
MISLNSNNALGWHINNQPASPVAANSNNNNHTNVNLMRTLFLERLHVGYNATSYAEPFVDANRFVDAIDFVLEQIEKTTLDSKFVAALPKTFKRSAVLQEKKNDCVDNIGTGHCKYLKKHHACITHQNKMLYYCNKTCKFCAPKKSKCIYTKYGCCRDKVTPAKGYYFAGCPGPCIDENPAKCRAAKWYGLCRKFKHTMINECRKTCHYCGDQDPCGSVSCPRRKKCIVNAYGYPECICKDKCKPGDHYTGTVCSREGIEYDNLCKLKQSTCNGKAKKVKWYGKCKKEVFRVSRGKCLKITDNAMCKEWKKTGACRTWRNRMANLCPHECGFCEPCTDNLSAYYCAFLAKHRACHRNPVRMAVYCRKTCGYCVQKQTCATMTCPPSKICVTTESGAKCKCLFECKKKLNIGPVCGQNGKTYDDMCDLINAGCATGDYLMVRHYGKCEKTSLKCRDSERESKKGLCKSWAEAKSCIYHSAYMRRFCPKTCGFCRQPIEPRCKRSKYGCCWHTQGDVAAKGKYGQGCGGRTSALSYRLGYAFVSGTLTLIAMPVDHKEDENLVLKELSLCVKYIGGPTARPPPARRLSLQRIVSQKLEFQWLLKEEVPSVLSQLKGTLEGCLQKFKSRGNNVHGTVYKADNFLLSLPNSDIVKGLISIAGDSVIKADLKFKIPKLSNGTFGTFIFEHFPWKLQQLQDANNHLRMALDEVNEREVCGVFRSGQEVDELVECIMSSLSKGKSLLLVPPKIPLSQLISSGVQRVLNPPVPDEVLVNFHVNCDKLVFCVYVLNSLTGAPSNLKNLPTDPSHIGHVFECGSRWYEVINRIEIVCTVPWLKEIIVLFNTAQQLCQQLKDKTNLFRNVLDSTDLEQLTTR